MSAQNLVSVLDVSVPSGTERYAVPHGLVSNGRPVAPTFVMPSLDTEVVIVGADETNLYLTNLSTDTISLKFRCERGLSVELDPTTIQPFFQNISGSSGVLDPIFVAGDTSPTTQRLVNTVSAVIPAVTASFAVAHGIYSNGVATKPTLITPSGRTESTIVQVDATNVYFDNLSEADETVTFRAELDLSSAVPPHAPTFVQGLSMLGGAKIKSIGTESPIYNAGTPTDPVIGLLEGGVTASKLGNGAVTHDKLDNGAVTPEKMATLWQPAGDGTYGSASKIPAITFNNKGLATGVTLVPVSQLLFEGRNNDRITGTLVANQDRIVIPVVTDSGQFRSRPSVRVSFLFKPHFFFVKAAGNVDCYARVELYSPTSNNVFGTDQTFKIPVGQTVNIPQLSSDYLLPDDNIISAPDLALRIWLNGGANLEYYINGFSIQVIG